MSVAAKTDPEVNLLKPQEGPQTAFLSSSADIVIYGGQAGGGKTYGLLLEPLRNVTTNKEFSAVYFRRNTTQIRNPGGLWDEAYTIYPATQGRAVAHKLEWHWPGGGKIKMAHLEHEGTVHDWQGSQIPLICFDELTHFSQFAFFYMLSRNRSACGVKPYIRASCNPDADSWVATFIQWWWDPETGYPIMERSGQIRWMIRINDEIIWADSAEELIDEFGAEDIMPKSVTFISASLDDNKILMEADPGYKANLLALSYVERERLLGGNWKIRPAAGLYFKREDAPLIGSRPPEVKKWVRKWDLAATETSELSPDPDWTVGMLLGEYPDGRFVIADVQRTRSKSSDVRKLIKRTAISDGKKIPIVIPQDPGQAGKEQAQSYVAMLKGFKAKGVRETGDKIVRAEPFAAQWQVGNVDVVKGAWNSAMFDEFESFPDGPHDDIVDAASGAFAEFAHKRSRNRIAAPKQMKAG